MSYKLPEITPMLERATELFLGEIEDQLRLFEEVLAELERAPDDEALSKALEARAASVESAFHLLKGGASFLGFADIRELGNRGQTAFRAWREHSRTEIQSLLRETVTLLSEATAELARFFEGRPPPLDD